MVLYLLVVHAMSSSIIIFLILGLLIAVCRILFLKKWHQYERRHFQACIEDLKKKKEDEMDLLFIQLLEWRAFTEEYKKLLTGLQPSMISNTLAGGIAELETRFEHLYLVTETDRKKYMTEMLQKDDYSEEYKKVMDQLTQKLTGMNMGQKAADTPLLNDNREN
jgi:hypothetical protein